MTDYTIVSRFRNKELCELLVGKIRETGKSCYNFCMKPADPENPDNHPEDQMKAFENIPDWWNDPYYRYIFNEDQKGLKEAKTVILLLPASISAHMEAGIAYGLGKRLILIGQPDKPETLYLIFKERYNTIEDFLKTIK